MTAVNQLGLRAATLDGPSWEAVMELARGNQPLLSDDISSQLRQHGLLTLTGELDSNWHLAIYEFFTAPITFDIAATWLDQGHTVTVALNENTTTSHTRRYRIERDHNTWHTTGVDPVTEFAVTSAGQSWPIISRVLPPRDALRAEPQQTPENEMEHHHLDPSLVQALVEALKTGTTLPSLPHHLDDALNTDCTVSITMMIRNSDLETIGVSHRTWTLGDEGLYHIRHDNNQATVTEVAPGDLGFTVLWLTMGALDVLNSQAEGAAK